LRDVVVDGRIILKRISEELLKNVGMDTVALFLFSVNTGVLLSNCKLLSKYFFM
jgi:hypothetical protein